MGTFALSGEVVETAVLYQAVDRAAEGAERDLLTRLKYLSGYF